MGAQRTTRRSIARCGSDPPTRGDRTSASSRIPCVVAHSSSAIQSFRAIVTTTLIHNWPPRSRRSDARPRYASIAHLRFWRAVHPFRYRCPGHLAQGSTVGNRVPSRFAGPMLSTPKTSIPFCGCSRYSPPPDTVGPNSGNQLRACSCPPGAGSFLCAPHCLFVT